MSEPGEVPSFGMGNEEEEKTSRRNFLKKAIGGAAGAGALYIAGERLMRHSIKSPAEQEKQYEREALQNAEVIENPKEYSEGEIIDTPITPVKIKGWRLLFQPLGMAHFAFMGTGRTPEKAYSYRIKGADGNIQAFISHFQTDTNPTFSQGKQEVKDGFFDQYQVVTLPGNKNPLINLDLYLFREEGASLEEEILSGKKLPRKTLPSKIYRYKARPKIFTHKEQGDSLRVLAEKRLSAADLKIAHDLHRLMSEYRPLGPIYILDERKGKEEKPRIAHYQEVQDQSVISADHFTNPESPNDGETTVVHELGHNLVRNSKLEGQQLTAWQALDVQHKEMTKMAENERVRTFPAFAIFREGTYQTVAGHETLSGHPESNPNELFASTLTTLRYYAPQFVDRLNQLDTKNQRLVKIAATKVLEFLKSMNSSEDTLKRLIPEIESIRKSLN